MPLTRFALLLRFVLLAHTEVNEFTSSDPRIADASLHVSIGLLEVLLRNEAYLIASK
jgi:hypothetical protein